MDTADTLAQRIKHLLLISSGKPVDQATPEELYAALVKALKEEIMISWIATQATLDTSKERILYYMSLEYLPGRLLSNAIVNLQAQELVQASLAKIGCSFGDIAACEPDPGLGHGGLGRLAACFLDSLATHRYPARAYGLRYQYGIFEQEIWNGFQVERPDCWLLQGNPWEWRRDSYANFVHFDGIPIAAKNRHGDDVYLLEQTEEVRALPYDIPIIGYPLEKIPSVLTLRLWSTKESPRNFQLQRYNAGRLDQAAENITLSDVLYPSDHTPTGKRTRLKQQYLLVSASLKDILRRHLRTYGDLSQMGDKVRIQINDTHPALVVAELVRLLTKNHNFSWGEAWEITRTVCSYTNHTILREALEEWDVDLLRALLPRQLNIIERLNHDFCNDVRVRYPSDEEKVRRLSIIEEGRVRMSHLAIVGSHKVNGVAALHSQILRERIFPDFAALSPDKFTSVTNGVTHRRWLVTANPHLSALITKRIGTGWISDFSEISKLANFAQDPELQSELANVKRLYKERLHTFLTQEAPIRDGNGHIASHLPSFPLDALVDVQMKRIHEYKRQLLNALHLIHLYLSLKDNPDSHQVKRLSLIAGKCAPNYKLAKDILHLLFAIARRVNRDASIQEKLRIAVVENYSVTLAETIIPAADLSEQISTAGWEASGTGNMKLAMNGALTIGTDDGANIEMRASVTDAWWPFGFGASAAENARMSGQSSAIGWSLYLEDPQIRRILDSLKDGTFSESEEEHALFSALHQHLLEHDHFFVLRDFRSYKEAQEKVESIYLNPARWYETVIHNIAAMGPFSSDNAIHRYAQEIWTIQPVPISETILADTRSMFAEHDRCFIK